MEISLFGIQTLEGANRAYSELIYHGAQPYACVLHAGNTRLTDRASELRGSVLENSMAMVCIN